MLLIKVCGSWKVKSLHTLCVQEYKSRIAGAAGSILPVPSEVEVKLSESVQVKPDSSYMYIHLL